MNKCIIVCAGEFVPIEIVRDETDLVIAADGGYEYCMQVGVVPDLIVGDFDSISPMLREEIFGIKEREPERVIVLPAEKDDTDTMAAIRIGLERGFEKFYLYAAGGGRMDHTIANLESLMFIKQHGGRGYLMAHDMLAVVIANEEISFHPGMQGTCSVFSMGEKAEGVTIRGMKYNVEDATLTNGFPLGQSNEFTEAQGTISVGNGALLIIVYWSANML
ncbi:MAG: thiamine diphosphokinase [Lachnospiraceae bacterium]|nr:thiamine diphosphokinase [Lachnospiraceae bacterium]